MYIPSHFEETRTGALLNFIRQHPFATLVVHDDAGLAADHVPLTLRPDAGARGKLLGHVARSNPLWRKAAAGRDCLVIFHGLQGYISPNGYATKAQTGRVVPTWNYEVVHVEGTLRSIDDPAWLRALLEALTREHEQGEPVPWQLADAPADYVAELLRAIVGIEIEIRSIVGKTKLSQNQPAQNRASLVASLRSRGDPASSAMADAIERRCGGSA